MSETLTTVATNTTMDDAGTDYLVLRSTDSLWTEIGRFSGRSAEQAIRNACKGYGSPDASTYVAVPARSWKPVTVKAEQTTVLKLEQAT